jgi:hypothetical protein
VRLRILTVALASTLAVAGLAGCRTNVGTAATVDGHRISETSVNNYVTVRAQPVTLQNADQSTSQVSPKSFVVQELIGNQLLLKILAHLKGAPTPAKIDAELDSERKGKTYTQEGESLGLKGFTDDFYKIVLRVQLLQQGLQSLEQSGTDLDSVVKKLHFPVSVSPRYGTWSAKTLGFTGTMPVPSYLKVQPAPATG